MARAFFRLFCAICWWTNQHFLNEIFNNLFGHTVPKFTDKPCFELDVVHVLYSVQCCAVKCKFTWNLTFVCIFRQKILSDENISTDTLRGKSGSVKGVRHPVPREMTRTTESSFAQDSYECEPIRFHKQIQPRCFLFSREDYSFITLKVINTRIRLISTLSGGCTEQIQYCPVLAGNCWKGILPPIHTGRVMCHAVNCLFHYLLLHAAAAALCVNTLLSKKCFHLLHCVTQTLHYVMLCGWGLTTQRAFGGPDEQTSGQSPPDRCPGSAPLGPGFPCSSLTYKCRPMEMKHHWESPS